jgi:hypothetical protein
VELDEVVVESLENVRKIDQREVALVPGEFVQAVAVHPDKPLHEGAVRFPRIGVQSNTRKRVTGVKSLAPSGFSGRSGD